MAKSMERGSAVLWWLLVAVLLQGLASCSAAQNSTARAGADDLLTRNKRTLIFNINSGVAKFVMSVLAPVSLPKVQSLNWAINLQAQYLVPDKSFYNPWGITRRSLRDDPADDNDQGDYSRQFLYGFLETVMNRHRIDGRSCLRRAICEIAQHPMSGNGHGFFGDLVDVILTPPKGSTGAEGDELYYSAHLAGLSGADCLQLFPECPRQHGLLERISVLMG